MLKEFREFALKGNMIDLAIGVIIGGAFGAVVTSLVTNVFTPLIGMITGGVDFKNLFVVLKPGSDPNATYKTAEEVVKAGGSALGYGQFLTDFINFLLVAFAVFMLVKAMNKLRKQQEEAPAAPPRQEVLLEEIRDALKAK